MSINEGSTVARQFVASREAFSTAWIKGTKIWQAVYTAFFVAFVGFLVMMMVNTSRGAKTHMPRYTGLYMIAVLFGASAVIGLYMFWRSRQKYVLSVTGDVVTIQPRGEEYSLADSHLAIWPHNGVALHLESAGHRFVLGGHGRTIGPSTPLDPELTQLVDARLPATDFDELLRLGGRAAARGPAPGEPTRCILFPNSQTIVNSSAFAFRKKQKLVNSLNRAQLFFDVDNDTLRVVDPESHATVASASVSRIAATPLSYETHDGETGRVSRTPALNVAVPGMSPLTVGCASGEGFSSARSVHVVSDPPNYVLSAADWRALIDKLGLAARPPA